MNDKLNVTINDNIISCVLYVTSFIWLFPASNFILPLLLWLLTKHKSETINMHGKNLLNFQITWALAGIVLCVIACLILPKVWSLGVFGLFYSYAVISTGITMLAAILIIVGATAAYRGLLYEFPLTYKFFK